MDKQLIQEVSRIHELMGVNNLIVESNRFTSLADDLVDIIKTVKGVDDISKLSRTEQDFFNALDAAVAGNKEDEIIDILKSYEKTSAKYIDEIYTELFNQLNNEIPDKLHQNWSQLAEPWPKKTRHRPINQGKLK